MKHWDEPLPPNRMARWVASHLRLLQIVWATSAIAYGVFIVAAWIDDGWDEAVVLLPSILGFVGAGLGLQSTARSVTRYDDQVARCDVRSGT
jgi:hypothetical protein